MESRNRIESSVRARKDLDVEEISESGSAISDSANDSPASDGSDSDLSSNASASPGLEGEDSDAASSENELITGIDALNSISFGALSRAQASLPPSTSTSTSISASKKRKRPSASPPPPPSNSANSTPLFKPRQLPPSRSSHHAPQQLSSRHAVPRFRIILAPPTTAATTPRDPRFDATVTTQSPGSLALASQAANRNYRFLTGYREDEVEGLRGRLRELTKKPKKGGKGAEKGKGKAGAKGRTERIDPSELAPEVLAEVRGLESEIARLTAHLRSAEQKGKVREVEREHKRKERERVASGGKGVYFLKKGEARRMVEAERVEGLGKRQREKTVRRREGRERKRGMGLGKEMGFGTGKKVKIGS